MVQVTQAHFEDDIVAVCETAQEEPVLVHSAGEPVAIVLSVDDYEDLVMQASGSGPGSAITIQDVDRESAEVQPRG